MEDPDLIARRLIIAKKLTKGFQEVDTTLTPVMRKIYEENPLWAFYVDKNGRPRRSFGVAMDVTGHPVLHTLIPVGRNLKLENTRAADLHKVDGWSQVQHERIRESKHPGLFQDPCGFLLALDIGREKLSSPFCDDCDELLTSM